MIEGDEVTTTRAEYGTAVLPVVAQMKPLAINASAA